MFVLDSLGMLSTEKEISDDVADKQVRDMTKSQLVKDIQDIHPEVGTGQYPNDCHQPHLRCHRSYVPTKEMGGVQWPQVRTSTIIYLSKPKEKEGTEVVGNIIKGFKTHKSRLSKENKDVKVRLYYDERGLDKYYGLRNLERWVVFGKT